MFYSIKSRKKRNKNVTLKNGSFKKYRFRLELEVKLQCQIICFKKNIELSEYFRQSILENNKRYEELNGSYNGKLKFEKKLKKNYLFHFILHNSILLEGKRIANIRGITVSQYVRESIKRKLLKDIKAIGLSINFVRY